MNIYRHETSQTTASGSVSSTTLRVVGGLLRQFLVIAANTATIFKANLAESGGATVLNYGYHTAEINDTGSTGALPLPVYGLYNINITNASPDDTFTIRILIQE